MSYVSNADAIVRLITIAEKVKTRCTILELIAVMLVAYPLSKVYTVSKIKFVSHFGHGYSEVQQCNKTLQMKRNNNRPAEASPNQWFPRAVHGSTRSSATAEKARIHRSIVRCKRYFHIDDMLNPVLTVNFKVHIVHVPVDNALVASNLSNIHFCLHIV